MMRFFSGLALVAAAAVLTAPRIATAQEASALDALFEAVDRPASPGCSVEIVRRDQPAITRTYGVVDLEHPAPITENTIFEAGSVSKQFTAAAIAVLASQGRLFLDDDVRRFVPELRSYGARITIRELLSHTSGLRNWDDLVELQGWPRGTRLATQAGVLGLLARQRELNFAPGSEYLYSNSNYVIAAIIVERASGMSFGRFSEQMLFAPIGMTRTRWRTDYTDVVPGRARAFTPDEAGVWHLDMPFEDLVGPGGLLTTTGDLLRWNEVLSHPSAAQRPWVDLLTTPGRLADGSATSYALGLELETIAGVSVVSHAGATAGYRAYLARVPAQGLSIAILCNAGNLNTEELGPKVTALYVKPAAPMPAGLPSSFATGARYVQSVVGRYRIERTGAVVTVAASHGGVSFNSGVPFYSTDGVTYRDAARTRSATVVRSGAGVASIQLTRLGNSDVVLVPVGVWAPDPAALAGFAGRYESDELDATYEARLTNGKLVLLGPTGTVWALTPLYRDVFDAGDGWLVTFHRAASRQVVDLAFSSTRSRDVRFARRPSTGSG